MTFSHNYEDIVREERLLGQLVRTAAQSGNARLLARAQYRYLMSDASKFVAAHRVRYLRAKKPGHGMPSQRTISAAAFALAQQMNVFQPHSEKAKIEAVKCGEGEYRLTVAFGPLAQAQQRLVANLLRHREGLPNEQTLLRGGSAAAITRAQQNFSAGHVYTAEVDIRRCYRSFRTERLSQLLRLPESVVEHVVRGHNLNASPSGTCRRDILHHLPSDPESVEERFQLQFGEEWEQARQGLLEGSGLSPVIAEVLLAPVVRSLRAQRRCRVVTYADNFFLAATNPHELRRLACILQDALLRHPAGPLTVHDSWQDHGPNDPFEFLGYRLTPAAGRLEATWARKHEARARTMRKEAYRELSSAMPEERKLTILSRVERQHGALTLSFGAWPGPERYHQDKMAKLRATIFPRGGPDGCRPPRRTTADQ